MGILIFHSFIFVAMTVMCVSVSFIFSPYKPLMFIRRENIPVDNSKDNVANISEDGEL